MNSVEPTTSCRLGRTPGTRRGGGLLGQVGIELAFYFFSRMVEVSRIATSEQERQWLINRGGRLSRNRRYPSRNVERRSVKEPSPKPYGSGNADFRKPQTLSRNDPALFEVSRCQSWSLGGKSA
jgi:hypothetical protein